MEIPEFNGKRVNFTSRDGRTCIRACPFNLRREDSSQICEYTVRVTEVFKGNYSVRRGWGELVGFFFNEVCCHRVMK